MNAYQRRRLLIRLTITFIIGLALGAIGKLRGWIDFPSQLPAFYNMYNPEPFIQPRPMH